MSRNNRRLPHVIPRPYPETVSLTFRARSTVTRTLDIPLIQSWQATVDTSTVPRAFKVKAASGPSMEQVGATLTVTSLLTGRNVVTTVESRPPTLLVVELRLAWPWLVGWYRSPTALSTTRLEDADGRTRISMAAEARVRPLAAFATVAVAFLLITRLTGGPWPVEVHGSTVTVFPTDFVVILVVSCVISATTYLELHIGCLLGFDGLQRSIRNPRQADSS